MVKWGVIGNGVTDDTLGVYSTKELAEYAGRVEVSWRQGDYTYCVIEQDIDPPISDERLTNHNECKITSALVTDNLTAKHP